MILGIFLILLWGGLISIFKEYSTISKKNDELMTKIRNLKSENENFEEDIEFYNIEENLEKKIREDFNYVRPGENMIIIVPDE